MLYLDLPTADDLRTLAAERRDACVSLYVETTPLTQHIGASRIAFGNLTKDAQGQLDEADIDKRRRTALVEELDDLRQDDGFWRRQAITLAVLATADGLRTYRLPNRLQSSVHVSDRFHIKPLLRAATFPQEAFVLALAENDVRVVHVLSEGPAETLNIPDLPKDASDAVGRADVNNRDLYGRMVGSEGQKALLRRYAREVNSAVRAALAGRSAPLILAATEPLASIYRNINTHPRLAEQVIAGSHDRTSDGELANAARPVIDALNAESIAAFHQLYAARESQSRVTSDVAAAARAATFGAIDRMLIDMDQTLPGVVDEETGAVTFADAGTPSTYGVVDEIACRALVSGAQVQSVRKADIPGGAALAAILRYPLA